MSLPIAATGPLNVEMKPILIVFCCAVAGPVAGPAMSASAAVPKSHDLMIARILSSRRKLVSSRYL